MTNIDPFAGFGNVEAARAEAITNARIPSPRRCAACGTPVARSVHWCSERCRLADEGPVDDRDDAAAG